MTTIESTPATVKIEHYLLIGHPGSGRTLWARRKAAAPPARISQASAWWDSDMSYIYRVAGLLPAPSATTPPIRAPHHTVSRVGMTGAFTKGWKWRLGELSLAHGGTLLLDELSEFRADVLEDVRHVMGTRTLSQHSNDVNLNTPCVFRLIATAHPCPCGWHGSTVRCTCSAETVARYAQRIPQWVRNVCTVITPEQVKADLAAKDVHT